jgi:hypothetical protein
MQAAALGHDDSEGAGQQANRATEDVQNQERESHTATAFSASAIAKSHVKRLYALCGGDVPEVPKIACGPLWSREA